MTLTKADGQRTEVEAVGVAVEKGLLYVIPDKGAPEPIGWYTCDKNMQEFLLKHECIQKETKVDTKHIRDGGQVAPSS